MKKTVLTTIVLTVLLSVLLLASCDSESLGNIRRFNLGYAPHR